MPKRLLIIEDEPDICEILVTKANHEKFQCSVELTGDNIIQRLIDIKPHIVILDLNLVSKSGIEVLQEIRSKNEFSKTPVIIYTAIDDSDLKETALTNGAQDFCAKHDGLDNLFSKIQHHISEFLWEGYGSK